MAVRHTRLDLSELARFLKVWKDEVGKGMIVIPPDAEEGELALEFKLDLRLPLIGRVGPITCQVVHKGPHGVAARIPEMPDKVLAAGERVIAMARFGIVR